MFIKKVTKLLIGGVQKMKLTLNTSIETDIENTSLKLLSFLSQLTHELMTQTEPALFASKNH